MPSPACGRGLGEGRPLEATSARVTIASASMCGVCGSMSYGVTAARAVAARRQPGEIARQRVGIAATGTRRRAAPGARPRPAPRARSPCGAGSARPDRRDRSWPARAATSPATKRGVGDGVQRRRGGRVGDGAGVASMPITSRGAARAGPARCRPRRSRRRRRARRARGASARRSPCTPERRRERLAWKKAPLDSRQPTARPPTSSILDRRLAVERRSLPVSRAKMALPRARLMCSTTPMTSGRAARNARASSGALVERPRRHPGRQHAAVVVCAQHDVAQIAGHRALVVGHDARLVEQRAQRGRDRRRAAAGRCDSPRCPRRRANAARRRPAPPARRFVRRHQLRSVAVAERARRRDAGRDRDSPAPRARGRRAPASRRAAPRSRGAGARSRRSAPNARQAGGRRAADGARSRQARPRLGRVRRHVLDHAPRPLAGQRARDVHARAPRPAPSCRRRRRRDRRT